jgi:predicted cobalt transporter CbtA
VNSLVISIIAGAIGMGYFIYGKRQAKYAPMIAGVLLCVYPYFTENLLWLSVIGVVLLVAPFVIDF